MAAKAPLPGHAVRVLRGGLAKWPFGLEIHAEELRRRLQGEKPPKLVDVRTSAEYEACRIEGTVHRPLDQIETWGPTLSKAEEIVLGCRTGRRSGLAQDWLARHGFRRVHNLLGGTAGWPYERAGAQCPP
ncbi:MAG: rhodanese-like domain-containing protein [Armatimonadetes bacterium]|nr:rhodanese-like domain-containing protein [Armatimonadota bacterium]